MWLFWGKFTDASSSMLLLAFEISEKFIPFTLLLLFMVFSAFFLFKTFITILSNLASLWQTTKSFFAKFTPVLFSNLMKTSSRMIWGIFYCIPAISAHSLQEFSSSLWIHHPSSVILDLLELQFSWSVFIVFSATIILLCRISLSLVSLSSLLWMYVKFSLIFTWGTHLYMSLFPCIRLSVRPLRTLFIMIMWSLFLVHMCKMILSPGVFLFKSWFLGLLKVQN